MLDVGLAWRGLDLPLLFGGVATWKALDLCARAALKHHAGEKVRLFGFSYATSVLNATVAVALGGTGLMLLWHAPPEARAFIPVDPSDPWFAASSVCACAGYIFSSWVNGRAPLNSNRLQPLALPACREPKHAASSFVFIIICDFR
jgi:hypothetical protein